MPKSMFVSGSLHRISGQISEASARMHQHSQEQNSSESGRIPELSDSDFHPALNEALRTFENGRIELIRATALPPEHAAGTAVQTAAKTDLADIPAGTLFRKGAAFFLPLILTILFSAFFLALSFIIAWKVAL